MRSKFRFCPQVSLLECRTVPSVVPNNALVIGASVGSEPFVVVVDPNTNRDVFRFLAFESSFRGGVSVATGDVVGDETPDIVVAAASNGGPRVAIYDGETGEVVKDFFVYEPTFRGGVSVAIGDVNGDGANDIITGTGRGGGPRVTAIDVETGNTLENFFAFEPGFRGGVNVGSDDVDGDGVDDIVVGAGVGGAPRVTVFEGDDTGNILMNFFAYDSSFRDGVQVNAADINGDDLADILIGSGTGGAPHVRVISGADGQELENFFAFDATGRGGARVAAVDTNGDDDADTLVVGTPGHLRRFFREVDGSEIAEDINVIDTTGGVFLSGVGDDFRGRGLGHQKGRGKGHDGRHPGDDSETLQQAVGGVITAVNPDLGTVTLRTGPTDTLAIYPVNDDTVLLRDGEVVTLDAFQEGDVAVLQLGLNRLVTNLVAVSSADGETTTPSIGRTIEGAVVAVDETAGTLTIMSRNGTLYLIETDDGTVFDRYDLDSETLLTDFQPGDFVAARIGDDGFANRVGTVESLSLGGDDHDDQDGNGSNGSGNASNGSGSGGNDS
jgi:hypothetical protein